MRMNEAKLLAISKLQGFERYRYFISTVCNFEEVWGLWREGWALASDDNGATLFVFWPAKEFAAACAEGVWDGYEASMIPLDDMLAVLLLGLKTDGILPCIFPTANDKGVIVNADELLRDLTEEREKYEDQPAQLRLA